MPGCSTFFNSFINLLVNGRNGERLSKEYIYDVKKFDLWFCSRGNDFSAMNPLNAKLSDYPRLTSNITYLSTLGDITIDTVFSADCLPASACYQDENWLDIPASAYLFSRNQYPVGCKMNRDYNHELFDYVINDMSDLYSASHSARLEPYNNYQLTAANVGSTVLKEWNRISDYYASNYMFYSGFNSSEYAVHGVPKEFLVENRTNVYSDMKSFDLPATNVVGGALLLTWYDGPREDLYIVNGELSTVSANERTNKQYELAYRNVPTSATSGNSLLCSYIELPKSYSLKNARINIEWSQNGIFSLI